MGWILALAILTCALRPCLSADVTSYSILKGQFLVQTAPETLVQDDTFGYSILVSVELADFYLATGATLRLPSGGILAMDDMGISWDYLDSFRTQAALNADYGWGRYIIQFQTVNEGEFACPIDFPSSPLPPTPRFSNFNDIQLSNPARDLVLDWTFSEPPRADDFVQVYINQGHAEVFSTPSLGMPGALDGGTRSLTLPAGTLQPAALYSLNLEITRIAATNATSYPDAPGLAATFRSTEVILATAAPPVLRLESSSHGQIVVEVVSDPGKTIVLQRSASDFSWTSIATNTSPTGTNLSTFPIANQTAGYFRALLP